MNRRIAALALPMVFLAAGLAAAEETAARVTGDKVRVRAGPGTSHAVLLEVNRDDLLVVLGHEGQWCKVRVPGGFICFVHQSLVKQEEGAEPVISASRVLLRVTAGKEVLPLATTLERGEVIEVIAREGEWLKIIPPARVHLFIYGEFVEELGPAREYRKSLDENAAARHKTLTASKSEEQQDREEKARQAAYREQVVAAGKAVLAGEGDTEELTRSLRKIVLETTDELTRGYAESLLLLLGHRREAELLRADLKRMDSERSDEIAALKTRIAAADERYQSELKKARDALGRSDAHWRRVGVVKKQDGKFALIDKQGDVVYLASERFRLEEYVGKRVRVSGRMVLTDPLTGKTHFNVEKLEILPVGDGGR
jgi:uncharacterized protein YgiM (DUF1202 family)